MIFWLLSILSFLPPNDPALNERVHSICPCQIGSADIQKTIDQMLDKLFEEIQTGSRGLAALAAPQLGISKRIIVVDTSATGTDKGGSFSPQLHAYINPEIIWQSEQTNLGYEECFSTSKICGLVDRFDEVVVQAYDRAGNISVEKFSGYTARLFQHEIDHLNGIRFPDRVQDAEHLHWVELEETQTYRTHWSTWDKKCPVEVWQEIKHHTH